MFLARSYKKFEAGDDSLVFLSFISKLYLFSQLYFAPGSHVCRKSMTRRVTRCCALGWCVYGWRVWPPGLDKHMLINNQHHMAGNSLWLGQRRPGPASWSAQGPSCQRKVQMNCLSSFCSAGSDLSHSLCSGPQSSFTKYSPSRTSNY